MRDLLTISAHEIIFLAVATVFVVAFFANVIRCDESLKRARSDGRSTLDKPSTGVDAA